jgi:phage-related protein
MSDSFTFDGIGSAAYGVYVFPTDSMVAAPARQYSELVVPGRSGVLLMDDMRYENIEREYGIVIADSGEENVALLRNMLASRVGYCRLTDTFDPDHYYMAAYNQNFTPVMEWRKKDMAKAKISFYRKPQRFLLTGENVITLTSSGNITNPTQFKSKPFIRVYGSGVLGVGSTNITIASHGYSYMDIDCETGRAYYGATSLDSKVTLNAIDFPTLNPGSNGISKGSGITRIEITPRWWEL